MQEISNGSCIIHKHSVAFSRAEMGCARGGTAESKVSRLNSSRDAASLNLSSNITITQECASSYHKETAVFSTFPAEIKNARRILFSHRCLWISKYTTARVTVLCIVAMSIKITAHVIALNYVEYSQLNICINSDLEQNTLQYWNRTQLDQVCRRT